MASRRDEFSKTNTRAKVGSRPAALLRGILNPRPKWKSMHSEGERCGSVSVSQLASGSDLQRPDLVATVMEHAMAVYRDILKVVLLTNRETHQLFRADVRDGCLAQRFGAA